MEVPGLREFTILYFDFTFPSHCILCLPLFAETSRRREIPNYLNICSIITVAEQFKIPYTKENL